MPSSTSVLYVLQAAKVLAEQCTDAQAHLGLQGFPMPSVPNYLIYWLFNPLPQRHLLTLLQTGQTQIRVYSVRLWKYDIFDPTLVDLISTVKP